MCPLYSMLRYSVNGAHIYSLVNSDLHFNIGRDGLSGCGLTEQGFANLWASARATWGVKGGKYFYEVRAEKELPVDLSDSEEHPHALRCVVGLY